MTDQRLRVLVVTDVHPPHDARIWFRECAALRAAGHELTMVAPFGAFGTDHPEVRTVDVPRSVGGAAARLRAMSVTAGVMLREAPRHDLVIVHDPELLPALGLVLAQRLLRRASEPVLVWDDHEDMPAQMAQIGVPPVVQRLGRAVLTGVELVAERVFKVLLAEHAYQDRFHVNHPVVPNSIPVPAREPGPADEPPRVVYLGALTWARGARELIEIARALPHITVEIMGNAKDDVHAALTAASAELPNLDYRGFTPNAEALGRLPGALAGLSLLHDLPNYAHSQPTKIMEYMAHGVPVITTPNPASADLVRPAACGIVIGFEDVAGAVDAVRELDADRARRDEMARAGYAVARRDHDWGIDGPRFVQTLERWVVEALEGSRRRRWPAVTRAARVKGSFRGVGA